MRTYTLLFLLFSFLASANNEKKTESTIEEVTVYLNGAQIKRTTSINVRPGTNDIILHNLSPTIDENSIQISGLKNNSIVSINFSINYLEKKQQSEELMSLKNKLQKLLLEKNSNDNIISGLQQEQKVLDNNQKISGDNTTLSLETIKQISTYYRKRSVIIKNEIYTITQMLNALHKNINAIKKEINILDDHTKEERGEIKLKLDATTASNLILEIRYNVKNAGWFPLYDIKSKSVESPLGIAYKANVYQQTGTDWKNASIILSTGDPNTNNLKPDLNTKYLNFTYGNNRRDNPVNMLDRNLESLNEVIAESSSLKRKASAVNEEKERAYNQYVEIKEEGITNTKFKIKKKYTINSNAEITVIEIDNFDMKADYRYYVAPELDENVFLTAKLGNWEQFDLLAGEANIYFEGSFAGKTNIDPLATTDSLTISLGVDPNIVVKREQLNDFQSKSFTGSNKIINRSYKISIKNNKKNKIYITLQDRIPISQNKEIKIDNINTDTSEYDNETGIVSWKLDIPSNQKEEKQFSYQIKYPKNKRINL